MVCARRWVLFLIGFSTLVAGFASNSVSASPLPPMAWTRERLLAYINGLPEFARPRLLAIANNKDQAKVAKIAIEDADLANSSVAAHTLTDQKLLAKVAAESPNDTVRWIATDRINGDDQDSLVKLIETTKEVRVRVRGIAQIKDEALRAKLKEKSNPGRAAVEKKSLEAEAEKILKSKEPGQRIAAIEVGVNVDALFKSAMEDPEMEVADAATKRLLELQKTRKEGITDETFEKIALGAKLLYPRRTAIEVVKNPAVLEKISTDADDEIRAAAAAHINDQSLLAKLAKDPKGNVRTATIARLTNVTVLNNLASSDPEPWIRKSATRRLESLHEKKK